MLAVLGQLDSIQNRVKRVIGLPKKSLKNEYEDQCIQPLRQRRQLEHSPLHRMLPKTKQKKKQTNKNTDKIDNRVLFQGFKS